MNFNQLVLAANWIKAQVGSYSACLERASFRFFDGQVTASELHNALVAAFGSDGGWK